MAKEPIGDVVVLLPGILGSVLERHGREVWALTPGAAFRALLSLGGSIESLRLDDDDPEADDLGDGVAATRVLPDLHLVPGLWKIDGYTAISRALHDRFDLVDGANYFEFPYDWRRDNRVHGRRLARQAHDWLAAWRARSGNDDARLVLLAHSMGGLVARTFLELYGGWQETRTLITFGTPYRGSLNALDFLANGLRRGLGPVGVDLTEFLRSLTSVYQLLPIYPVVETPDQMMLRVSETDLPGVDRWKARAALGFHREIETAVDEHRETREYLEHGYQLHPVIGIGQPTLQGASFDGTTVTMLRSLAGRDLGGDGTVPRASAIPVEWHQASAGLFSHDTHASLQNAESVIAQVTGIVTGADIDLDAYRDHHAGLSIDVPDLARAAEGLRIAARPTGGRDDHLTATVTDADTGAEAWSGPLTEDVDWHVATTPPLEPAIYRVTVSGTVGEVSDLVWLSDA